MGRSNLQQRGLLEQSWSLLTVSVEKQGGSLTRAYLLISTPHSPAPPLPRCASDIRHSSRRIHDR